jgi:hypothetical protein
MLFAWRALVGSGRLGSGCLVLRADTRENPGGKNGVMTVGSNKWKKLSENVFKKPPPLPFMVEEMM